MRRRLPLLGVPQAAEPTRFPDLCDQPRVELRRGSVGVVDTSSGLLAAELAVQLATALVRLGTRVALVLLGYQGVPVLPAQLSARLTASVGAAGERASVRLLAYAVDAASPPALPPGLVLEPDEATLWVGLPAVCSFAPTLALLLGADRPFVQWPDALRARRPSCQLELSQDRSGFAATLAAALNEHGFLLRR